MAVIKSEYLLPNYDPEEVGMKGEKGDDGKTSYLHIAYSNSSDGGVDFSTTDASNRAFMGSYSDSNMIDSSDPSKYEWQRVKGDPGKDGVAGKDGVGLSSTAITYAASTSASVAPSSGWNTQVPTVAEGSYLWTKTVWNYTDNTSETGYSVARMGADGDRGQDGIAGKDGVGIKTTVIEYVVNTSGTIRPTSGWSTTIPVTPEGQYLWTRTTWTYTDNTTEQGYSVAKQGEKGDSSHFHTAYAWSADGTDRFTDKYPIDNLLPNSMFNSQMGWTATMLDAGSTQSGIANGEAWLEDLTATTSRWKQWQIYFDNNRYPDTFELIKANPNKRVTVSVDAKVEGNTIKYPGVVELSLRSSTGDNWVRLRVDDTKISSEYTRYTAIGTLPSDFNNVQNFRLILTFIGNGRATFTKPKLAIGNDGFYTPAPSEDYENAYPMYIGTYSDSNVKGSDNPTDYTWARSMGNEGPNGVGIASTIIEYNKSTSSTTKPTTGWTSGIPSISGGEYLWTRTTLNYTNSTKAESYTVSRQGQDGSDGQLFTGEFAPTNFNEGDLWYKVVSGKVTAVFKATSGQWIEVPFDSSVIAETIVGKTIQASHLTGSTIDGGKISGAEFLNEYENVTTGVNQVADGKLAIKNGILQAGSTYYLTNSAGERLYTFATTDADIHQGTVNLMQKVYDKTGKQTSQSTTGISGGLISLALSDASGNYHGVLDAKALTKTPWINIQMSSAFTVAENNPPQYRVTYNLDGTRRVAFRGQFKLVSGNMTTDRQYCPFQTGSGTEWNGTPTLPLDIAPPRAVFAALTVMPPSGPAIPGRMGMNTIAMMGFAPGTTTVHVNLSGFEYDID